MIEVVRVRRSLLTLTVAALAAGVPWHESIRARAQVFTTPQARVENVQFEQRAGGTIHLTYDLVADDPRAVFHVTLEVSQDGGATFNVKPTTVSGDIGPAVRAGSGKQILWDAAKDVEAVRVDQFRFRILPTAGRATPAPADNARRADTGALAISSQPAGASVFINGAERGRTPLTLSDLAPGRYSVRLVSPGFLENTQVVQIQAGSTEKLDVNLTAAPAAVQKKGSGRKWAVIGGVAAAGAAVAALAGGGGGGNGDPVINPPPPGTTPPPPPPPVVCTFTVALQNGALQDNVGTGGGEREARVTASAETCTWTAASNVPWITITSGTSGTGNGVARLRIAENNSTSERTGTVTVAGMTVTLTQAGESAPPPPPQPGQCEYGLTSSVTYNFGAGGGSGTITFRITSGSNCAWTASVPAAFPWITVHDRSGTGDIRITFSVAANAGAARSGRIEVRWVGPQAGQNIQINQAASGS